MMACLKIPACRTVQAYLKFDRGVGGPHLVVVPLSVLANWVQEFKRFAPDMRVVRIHVNDEGVWSMDINAMSRECLLVFQA